MATADLLDLQRYAGNRATLQLIPEATTRDSVAAAAETIVAYFANSRTPEKLEALLRALLLNHDRSSELRTAYASWGRNLDADLASLGGATAVRALDSLDHGELRVMSKVLIALADLGTDDATLFRVLRDANRVAPAGNGIDRFETMWQAVTAHLPEGVFDRFHSGSLADHLDGDLDGYELIKAHATLAYGDLRPIDQVYIAVVQAGTDEQLLFQGLARCNPDSIEAEFRNYEFRGIGFSDAPSSIWDSLEAEMDGEDYRRALALLDREINPDAAWYNDAPKTRRLGGNQRLVALVSAAVHGAGTNFELILTSIDDASQAERDELKARVEDESDPLGLRGAWGDLSGGELSRLRSKLGIAEPPGEATGNVDASTLADPTVALLRGLGGVDDDTVLDTIKSSSGATWLSFKRAYVSRGPFMRYVDANLSHAADQAHLSVVLSDNLDERIRFCFGTFSDDEDYLWNLLQNFASNADRRRIAGDAAWMDLFRSSLSGHELNKALLLLKPTDLTPPETAAWLAQAVERERSGSFDLVGATGDALQDENRELQAGTQLGFLDAHLSPEEARLLQVRAARTGEALEAYTAARDEFANTASMVANVAVSVIIAGLTGGAAGPLMVAQLARAAAAMAVAKVLTEKVIRGDRFDVIGADGAVAFATGAVEGVMNVAGGLAAKNVLSGGLETVGLSAQQASGSLFRGAARSGLLAATEGGMAGGSTNFVDTLARDETWREGIITGLERVASGTASGAATGAGMAVAFRGALAGVRTLRGAVNERLPLAHADNPLCQLVLGAMLRPYAAWSTSSVGGRRGSGTSKRGRGWGVAWLPTSETDWSPSWSPTATASSITCGRSSTPLLSAPPARSPSATWISTFRATTPGRT